MMKCYLDSNVLIYLKDEYSLGFEQSSALIKRLVSQRVTLCVSTLCLDEFLHEFGKALRKKTKENEFFLSLKDALMSILQFPHLLIVNPPNDPDSQTRVILLMKDYSLRPRDAYHLITMQAHAIDGFATFDSDFTKVFAAKLLTKA